ncbi:MAG: SDR family oxidoreductase [Candidatus Dormibacteria bacterium]
MAMDGASSPDRSADTVAVVTGAGRGIGRSIARRLRGDGYVVIAAARTEADLTATAAGDRGIVTVPGDVSLERDVEALATVADGHGRLAVWVNNASILEKIAFADLEPAVWNRVMGTNLFGAYLGCRAAYRRMAAASGGSIVNIASLSGVANVEKFPELSAYNVSKAGVIALTEAVALEGAARNVRCTAISPGAVDTEMLRRAAPHLRAGMTPNDVAAIVSFLVGDAGAHLSGTNIPIFSNRPDGV